MPLPDFPPGARIRLTGGALRHHRKLSNGGPGMSFADSHLTANEAGGTFTFVGAAGSGIVDGRDAIVRSDVTGREGRVARDMLRKA